ncbi:MAG: glycine--tRNA ligase subunit beta [Nitrospirae bacterium]|nr:glycine--tRNA ligase subunit beta [Nitrospirota bacterium]
MGNKDFSLLFEIGIEEIPAGFIPKAMSTLHEEFIKLLKDSSIDFGKISEHATPRRLAIIIENVAEKQNDRTLNVLGPPKKAAFDDSGNPTKAAIGFAKSQNVDVKKLKVVTTEKGEYVAAIVEEKGRKTTEVLAETLPGLIASIPFPKSMRWGNGTLRFARPIHWILAILGKEVIPFELDGLKSSNLTRGHRFLSPAAFQIKEPLSYSHLLESNYVIANYKVRKNMIVREIEDITSKLNCKVHMDEDLLDTVTSLVEYPKVVLGNFDGGYLCLPKELLITVMKSHQKYFSVEDNDENLLPHFLIISNTKIENSDTVRAGAARVLKARLEDARFYFDEDRKKPLGEYVEKLKNVTYHEKLGSLYEKAERIASLSSFIAEKLGRTGPIKEKAIKTSMLCKADLVTGVVREFPELQGYMGMIYAKNSGEDDDVASAIYEHYMPRFSGDSLPSGETGTIVSLADRMDNIASFFALGLIPTGSEDPFALRRQASGITNILYSSGYLLPVGTLIDTALRGLPISVQDGLSHEILKFFDQRIEGMLLSEGYKYDLVNSVLSTGGRVIKDIKNRIEVLSAMREEPEFSGLLTAAKRVYNILTNAQTGNLREDMLTGAVEKALFSTAMNVGQKLMDTNFRALFELKEPINHFFDNVLVMDNNPEIRGNRLALLSAVKRLFDSLGDFSKIVE